ncbi:MAG: hypothetical protein KTR28_03310 [Micavibrio sp.]|nr:hypothetical protein [Micavibrio sp.]
MSTDTVQIDPNNIDGETSPRKKGGLFRTLLKELRSLFSPNKDKKASAHKEKISPPLGDEKVETPDLSRNNLSNVVKPEAAHTNESAIENKGAFDAKATRAAEIFKKTTGISVKSVIKGTVAVENLDNGQAELLYRVRGQGLRSRRMKFNNPALANRLKDLLDTQTLDKPDPLHTDILVNLSNAKEPGWDNNSPTISAREKWAQTLKANAVKPVPDLRAEMGNAAYNDASHAAYKALIEAKIPFKDFKFANSVDSNITLTRHNGHTTMIKSEFSENTHNVARILSNWALQSAKGQKVRACTKAESVSPIPEA